jgi:hypothetical protein
MLTVRLLPVHSSANLRVKRPHEALLWGILGVNTYDNQESIQTMKINQRTRHIEWGSEKTSSNSYDATLRLVQVWGISLFSVAHGNNPESLVADAHGLNPSHRLKLIYSYTDTNNIYMKIEKKNERLLTVKWTSSLLYVQHIFSCMHNNEFMSVFKTKNIYRKI